jgi:hypothetical protein
MTLTTQNLILFWKFVFLVLRADFPSSCHVKPLLPCKKMKATQLQVQERTPKKPTNKLPLVHNLNWPQELEPNHRSFKHVTMDILIGANICRAFMRNV